MRGGIRPAHIEKTRKSARAWSWRFAPGSRVAIAQDIAGLHKFRQLIERVAVLLGGGDRIGEGNAWA